MNSGVPITVPLLVRWLNRRALQMPKSITLMRSLWPARGTTMMFSGLRSRCTTPSWCAASSAAATWLMIADTCGTEKLRVERISPRFSPGRYSMTR